LCKRKSLRRELGLATSIKSELLKNVLSSIIVSIFFPLP
jgi:hypothetical protein